MNGDNMIAVGRTFRVYVNNIFCGVIKTNMSIDGKDTLHIPEEMMHGIGNKYFHIDLFEE